MSSGGCTNDRIYPGEPNMHAAGVCTKTAESETKHKNANSTDQDDHGYSSNSKPGNVGVE